MSANSGPERALTDAGGDVRLDADSIDAIAQRVADILRSESLPTRQQLLTATDVAARFGVSRAWVYDNAERLGAIRLGTGSKARLRFDPQRVSELIQPEPHSRDRPARHSPLAAKRWLDKADLIPIRGN
jgi:predicted DNA-binding transcriptional regulator AlpA